MEARSLGGCDRPEAALAALEKLRSCKQALLEVRDGDQVRAVKSSMARAAHQVRRYSEDPNAIREAEAALEQLLRDRAAASLHEVLDVVQTVVRHDVLMDSAQKDAAVNELARRRIASGALDPIG